MKAWRVAELGEPAAAMRLADVEAPSPGPRQLVVRVLAAPANFPDVLMCRGHYQVRPELPFTPGVELCGEVVALGADVGGLVVGDRVIGASVLPHGGFAELAVMDAATTFPAPAALDDAQAASLYIGYQTGWFGLHRRAGLRAGETLLVHAAAGGVGSAAVQLGKAAGATVIGVVGGPAKAEVARVLGADVVVDRHTEDFVAVVKEHTEGRGADVIYDPVGGETYLRSTRVRRVRGPHPRDRLRRRPDPVGRAQPRADQELLDPRPALGPLQRGGPRRGRPVPPGADRAGRARPGAALVSERVGLAQAADAAQRLADGTTVGRVVVTP